MSDVPRLGFSSFRVRALVVTLLCCAAVVWFSGPVGRLLVVLPLVLFAPGFLFVCVLSPPIPVFARPIVWLGVSLSLVALLYEWATVFGVALSEVVLGGMVVGCGVVVVVRVWRGGGGVGDDWGGAWYGWGLALVVALTLWVRFEQIADLALPAWVDSVHHALLIRVAVERGMAPVSLRPYLPIDQLPYHWGYHVFMALVIQVCHLPIGQAMLWVGQVMNALHVVTGATLAVFVWGRFRAGVVAAVVIGVVSIMPAYFVSWGRYTQLEGLLLVPPVAIVWVVSLRSRSYRGVVCCAVLLAGLSLVHVRVLVFTLVLLVVMTIGWLCGEGWGEVGMGVRLAVVGGVLMGALAAPWLWGVVQTALFPAFDRPGYVIGEAGYNALSTSLLWAGQNRWLVALGLWGALYGVHQRLRGAAVQVIWVGGLVLLANPWLLGVVFPAIGVLLVVQGVRRRRGGVLLVGCGLVLLNVVLVPLPYLRLLTNESVVISLFLPIAVLVGGGASFLFEWGEVFGVRWAARWQAAGVFRRVWRFGGVGVVVVLAVWGAWMGRQVVNPATVLATSADVAAIAWVDEHTPPGARFLINAVPWFPGVDRGADGGWWLLPLTGRWVSTPPALFIYGPLDDVQARQEFSAQVTGFHAGDERRLYALMEQGQIDYVYLGAKPGPLTLATFADVRRFERVYQYDGVTILAVHR